jgi:hypothetical protein
MFTPTFRTTPTPQRQLPPRSIRYTLGFPSISSFHSHSKCADQNSDEKKVQLPTKPEPIQNLNNVLEEEEDVEQEEHVNPQTGERGGYKGPEPTRHGDWEHRGRATDF